MVSVAEKRRRAEAGGRAAPRTGRILQSLQQPGSALRDEPESAPVTAAPPQASAPAPAAAKGSRSAPAGIEHLLASSDHRGATEDETIALIEHYLDHPPSGSVQMTFTKHVSQYVIDRYNEGNRPVKPASIRDYAADMAADNWALTGESMKFSDARRFRDGQNRLYASIRSGASFQTDVRFGVPDASFSKMDRGKARSAEDVLSIAGYTDTRTLSTAVRWIALYDDNRIKSRTTYKPDEILHLVRTRYADLPEHISKARQIYQTTTQPRGMVTALLYLATRENAEKAKAFADAFEMGNYAGAFAPLKHAIRRLEQIRVQSQGRVHELVRFAILIKAWNAYVEGKRGSLTMMNWSLDEDFPKLAG